MSQLSPKYLIIGTITRPHGIRGELRIQLHTDYPERVNTLKTIYLGRGVTDSKIRPFAVHSMRLHQGAGLLTLKEITDRSQAELLRDFHVMVAIEDAVPLEEDEFYLFEVIGMDVQLEDGTSLGSITEVIETGANDVYVIKGTNHPELLFPAIAENTLHYDFEKRVLIVRLPDGLV
ncbi:MAG: ribosome maturation factor RimM [Phototrophicaceae bacterium]